MTKTRQQVHQKLPCNNNIERLNKLSADKLKGKYKDTDKTAIVGQKIVSLSYIHLT